LSTFVALLGHPQIDGLFFLLHQIFDFLDDEFNGKPFLDAAVKVGHKHFVELLLLFELGEGDGIDGVDEGGEGVECELIVLLVFLVVVFVEAKKL
jgi:hypothetical protein